MENITKNADDTAPVRPLHLLTTDIVLADLISGREIATEQSIRFKLTSVESRSVLNWYREHRDKWAGTTKTLDCEAIVNCISSEPPNLPGFALDGVQKRKILRLVKVTAHRFAGLHAFGAAEGSPSDFEFEPEKLITLFEGYNGSGKTSLINALIWCLTGMLIRPQRLPENASKEFTCYVDRDSESTSQYKITPVTPLPSETDLPDATVKSIPADTWVEVIFIDDDGNTLPPFRRTQSRSVNGKLLESVSDSSVLGVDPIAFRLGTSMPGMIPFLQVGSVSELGVAVTKLTGLADLVDLAKQTEKARERICGQIKKKCRVELDQIEIQFDQICDDIRQRIQEFPAMAPPQEPPKVDDKEAKTKISELKSHFELMKVEGLMSAKKVLGEAFSAEDHEHRKNLEQCIGPAILQINNVNNLPSIKRLGTLKLKNDEIGQIRSLISKLHEEAEVLAELANNPVLARRTQLYARVSSWITEHGESHEQACVVCHNSLEGLIDPETGLLVVEHLKQVRETSDLISRTLDQWLTHWTGVLSRDLPPILHDELNKDLPPAPGQLLRQGLVDELFKTDAFSGTLAVLHLSVKTYAEKEIKALPIFVEPHIKKLPAMLCGSSSKLEKMLRRIERVLGYADWMATHSNILRNTLNTIRGRSDTQVTPSEAIIPKLETLDLIVKGVAPISAAIKLVERLNSSFGKWNDQNKHITACDKTALALSEIFPIGNLAQAQVDALRQTLQKRSTYWRNQIYQNATSFSPKPKKTNMDTKGVIDIHVGREGVRAPLQHISNASALRANLFGFYLAFREHVLKTNGGIDLLMLDDPQDLLDCENRQRLARALANLATDGAQIVTTTHDRNFARDLVASSRSQDLIAHRSIHPVNSNRQTLETSLAVEELDQKHLAFVNNKDSALHAQDYVNEARIFLETQLGDLFDDPTYLAYSTATKSPTLFSLFDRLQNLVNTTSNERFNNPLLNRFCKDPAMQQGAKARQVLNLSHHDKASICYTDALSIDEDLLRIRKATEQIHKELRHFCWPEQ